MHDSISGRGKILITGGTSGLGLELVRLFLQKGYFVAATGRRSFTMPGFENNFRFYQVDFSNLGQTAVILMKICKTYEFDLVVNNAGILSPPDFILTNDGFEYTFQVNFLAHLLVNEIIIQHHDNTRPLKSVAVTSTVYRIAAPDLKFNRERTDYKPLKAYSDSKLYLSLMCRYLSVRYHDTNIMFFSFVPGVFGSGIYRMQSAMFRILYQIAAPFMRKPSGVARTLAEILTGSRITNGSVYDIRKRIRKLPEIEPAVSELFWKEAYRKIVPYLS